MTKTAVIYARVSSEKQAGEDKVSIPEQLDVCTRFCEDNDYNVIGIFIDDKRYKKTKYPLKGRIVEPSGKYNDRPDFVKMLEALRSGDIDAIVSFDLDRFGRHERVLGAYIDALDIADSMRRGKREIKIYDAVEDESYSLGRVSDMVRDARKENEKRAKRFKMGRIGTLKMGLWPSKSVRYGYKPVEAVRGYTIEVDNLEAEMVRFIFQEALTCSIDQIRVKLLARGYEQRRGNGATGWPVGVIHSILASQEYLGQATWTFSTGESYTIDIPQLVTPELFKAVQKKLSERQAKSLGSLKRPALLHHIGYCGACGAKLSTATNRHTSYLLKDGTRVKNIRQGLPPHVYQCMIGRRYPEKRKLHDQIGWSGPMLDDKVWRALVDDAINNPDLIREQVERRQAELQENGNQAESDIERCQAEIKAIEAGRQKLMDQLSRGNITEADFETVITRRNSELEYWREELERARILRDEHVLVQENLNIAYSFLKMQRAKLSDLDRPIKELEIDEQIRILTERRNIVQSLADRVIIYGSKEIVIEGMIDPSETVSTDITTHRNGLLCFVLELLSLEATEQTYRF